MIMATTNDKVVFIECVVIGCGISGIAVSRWLKEYHVDFVVFEKSNDLGGLWRFQRDGYGVMDFTHINVSKYNYHFSDFPFPSEQVEFMHHKNIYNYAKAYMEKFKLFENVKFNYDVTLVEEVKSDDPIRKMSPSFNHVKVTDKLWKLTVKSQEGETTYVTPFVAVCTGHHGEPRMAKFDGQETFKGEIIHSVKYKSAKMNNYEGKRVLLVGIGNSAVDAADNLVTEGNCPKVTISTRSGAWVFPNYISGIPAELYINRLGLMLPWNWLSTINESIIKFINGDPKKFGLNPKHRVAQSHPTISPTLNHHLQRGRINIEPNIKKINGSEVIFDNGDKQEYDSIILCTGYRIMLDFLHRDIKDVLFEEKEELHLNLFKMVFSPEIGNSMAFVGFVQPHTGGILAMSEVQARWFVYLMTGKIKLPARDEMTKEIRQNRDEMDKRFYASARHTMQEDPLNYNDSIAEYFGARPSYLRHPKLAWRILLSSGGAAQWRLDGIDAMPNAAELIEACPVPPLSYYEMYFLLFLAFIAGLFILCNIWLLPLVALPVVAYRYLTNKSDKK